MPAFPSIVGGTGQAGWVDIHDYDGVNPRHGEFIEAADFLFMSSVAHLDWRGFMEARIGHGTSVGVCTQADGASGITAADGWVGVDANPVPNLVDSNGAGDAFFARFVISWAEGRGLPESLDIGARAAARVVQSPELAPLPRTD